MILSLLHEEAEEEIGKGKRWYLVELGINLGSLVSRASALNH